MAGFQPTVMLTMFKHAGKMGSHENHSQCFVNNDEQQSDKWSFNGPSVPHVSVDYPEVSAVEGKALGTEEQII
jgi:hypothetical protein